MNRTPYFKNIGSTVFIVGVICIFGKFCAGIREILIAKFFGAGAITDSYVIATSLPFRLGLMIGSVSYMVFIPIFSKYLISDKKSAYVLFNTCFMYVLLILNCGVVMLLYYSNFCVELLAFGLSVSSKILAVRLMQIIAAALVLLVISSLLRAVNSTNKHYIVSSFYETSANIINLIAIVILVPFFGVYGLAIGLLLGAIGQLILQGFVFLKTTNFKNFNLNFLHPGIREFGISLIPMFLIVAIVETNFFIMRRIASILPVGSISALNFAFSTTQFSVGILDFILLIMVFPFIAGLVNQGKLNQAARIVIDISRVIIFALLPLTVFIIILREPIIEILFQRGAFNLEASTRTSSALGFFSLCLCAWGLDYLFFRIYYLMKMMKMYSGVLLIRVGLNTILNLVLIRYFAHSGIAFAFSIALSVHLIILLILLGKRLEYFNVKAIRRFFLKTIFICGIMGLPIYLLHGYLDNLLIKDNILVKLLNIVVCFLIATFLYLLSAKLVIPKEINLFRNIFRLKSEKLDSLITYD